MSPQTTLGRYDRHAEIARLEADWAENPRWQGIIRTYTADDVVRLRGSIKRDNTIAKMGAEKLRGQLAQDLTGINAQTALTGGHAVQQVKAGAQAIYLSGSHATADQSTAETIRPDQSLYAINSVPSLVRRINNAFERADQIQWQTGNTELVDYFAPIVADAEAHTGGALNAFELMKNMIRAGAAGVHFDDQFTSAKPRGHRGRTHTDNVLMPTRDVVQKLSAARLAADVEDVPTVIIAHTTANTAGLLSSDCDTDDRRFMTGECSEEGFYEVRAGIEQAIARGLAYAPYADVLWLETAQPDLEQARQFAATIRREHPNQLLAYSCTSSDDQHAEQLQRELSALGYRFLFMAPAAVRADSLEREELAA